MNVIFRDINPLVAEAVAEFFPEWDVACGPIFRNTKADILISPANVTGRMDGGIDQVYINRFGWQLEVRLMRDIQMIHQGHLPIGQARLISTYDQDLPMMICAPTMAWPPGDVSKTQNAYLAFSAVMKCALSEGIKALNRKPTLLVPGLCTSTGRMNPMEFAKQMRRAWDENIYLSNLFEFTYPKAHRIIEPLVDASGKVCGFWVEKKQNDQEQH